MGNRSFKMGWLAKGALVVGAVALFAMTGTSAHAASLRRSGSTGANANGANGGPTGNYLFTWYATTEGNGNGDNALRLVDPNGCGNGGTSNANCAAEVDECAMIYVFDDNQEMGECCGCPITPNELEDFSVEGQLTSNWALATNDSGSGTLVVVGSAFNSTNGACALNSTCNGEFPKSVPSAPACDPTVAPVTTGDTNLDGSITHNQLIGSTSGLTEISLFDQGNGDPVNNAYLVSLCGSLTGDGSHNNGFCHCPVDDTP